ncbi:MAG TPA: response regulator [Sphaerochaeta sp.]|nr:response regulator [Sphaerochaeta sp.]
MDQWIKVLVVEDEDVLRKGLILTTAWDKINAKVIGEADNGSDGYSLALRLQPDLIVTDVAMPGMDGLEMIKALVEKLTDIEFIIISGHAEFEYAQQALELGVKGYILKPIDPTKFFEVLQKTVKDLQDRKKSQKEFFELEQLREQIKFFSPIQRSIPTDYRDQYIESALNLIEERYNQAISLGDFAEALGISERTLSSLFKERTGYTFLEYVTLYRMRIAAELLQQKDIRVQEVAPLVGYRDYRYFIKIFKSCFDLTPLEYKKGHTPQ